MERIKQQKPLDDSFWMIVMMQLGDAEKGRFETFQNAFQSAMHIALADGHWSIPGAGDSPQALLPRSVVTTSTLRPGAKPPRSMGYIMGGHRGIGRSWMEEEQRWGAIGHPGTEGSGDGYEDVGELCMRHPGDRPADDGPGAAALDLNERFAPLTTKAAELVYAITMCAPAGADEAQPTDEVTLRSRYQMQLQLKVDPTRELLVYDCYEFVPSAMFDGWPGPTKQEHHDTQKCVLAFQFKTD